MYDRICFVYCQYVLYSHDCQISLFRIFTESIHTRIPDWSNDFLKTPQRLKIKCLKTHFLSFLFFSPSYLSKWFEKNRENATGQNYEKITIQIEIGTKTTVQLKSWENSWATWLLSSNQLIDKIAQFYSLAASLYSVLLNCQ